MAEPIATTPTSPRPQSPKPDGKTREAKSVRSVALRSGKALVLRADTGLLSLSDTHFSPEEIETMPLSRRGGAPLWLALDQHPPRSSEGRQLTLSDLIDEDEEVAPGSHRLLSFSLKPDEIAFAQVVITVETNPKAPPQTPECALFLPRGTYNGKAATRTIELLAVPFQGEIDAVNYRVSAPGFLAEGTFPAGTTALLEGAPNGDVLVTASCQVDGQRLPSAERVITLNGDTEPLGDAP